MIRKKHLTPIGRHGRIVKHSGKGGIQQDRSSPMSMDTVTSPLTGGRAMNNYDKSSGLGAPTPDEGPSGPLNTPDIGGMAAASPMGAGGSPMGSMMDQGGPPDEELG
jgi:hypothetical protein